MNLNKLIVCGMLLGLLSLAAPAQRVGARGTVPGARLPNAVNMGTGTVHAPSQGSIAPKISKTPNAHSKTVAPNATTVPDASRIKPNAGAVPNARELGNGRAVTN